MDLQFGESLESSVARVKEYLNSIEASDLVNADKIYACSLYLIGVSVKVNSTNSTYKFENFQMDNKSYGDYEMIIRRIEPVEKGLINKLRKKFKSFLNLLNPTLLRKFKITLHESDDSEK